MLIIKSIINGYQETKLIAPHIKSEAAIVNRNLFTAALIENISQIILSKFLIMTKDDFELWEEDSESFIINEIADQFEYNVRLCAERLFSTILAKYSELLIPRLIFILKGLPSNLDMKLFI